MPIAEEGRRSPESFLSAARAEHPVDHPRGHLKVFLGASPGVGKTFAMLEEARSRKLSGIDVVVALVETHGRSETAELLKDLEYIPRQSVLYRGQTLSEMDIDALIRRRPQLALIDEFAHTNAPGSRHPKRWQDVMEVLDAGIDVITTLNIQHIESLNDVVARITGVQVQETVPDAVFQRADELELIDLPPDELIRRMKAGKVYVPGQVGRALENFFTKGKLTALRELALRTAASRVDDEMLGWMRTHGVEGPWPAQERLLVCINEAPAAKALIRTAKLMATRARIPWIAATVITPRHEALHYDLRTQTAEAMRLAESLGAEPVTLQAESNVAEEILRFARARNVTRLLVGRARSQESLWHRVQWFFREPVFVKLLDGGTDFEVTVVTPHAKAERRKALSTETEVFSSRDLPRSLLDAVLATTASTIVAWPFWWFLPVASLAAIYLVGVLWVGMRRGLAGALTASVIGFLAYNFFFTVPYYSFAVEQEESVVALVVFVISATFIGTLAGRLRGQVESMRVSKRRTDVLYDFARKLASANTRDDVLWAASAHVATALECRSLILLPDADGRLQQVQGHPSIEEDLDPRAETAALWAFEKNESAGTGTATLPTSEWLFVPLATAGKPMGVIGIAFLDKKRTIDSETKRLLAAVEDQIAVAVERLTLSSAIEESRLREEAEKLRAALLNSVSHDLRTPLVTIIGALTSILNNTDPVPSEADRRTLSATALEEARRLNRFVQNLLDMTRLGYGSLVAKRVPLDIREVIGTVRNDLRRVLADHDMRVDIPAAIPLVLADPVLLGQAIANILENAAKYSSAKTTITVSGSIENDKVNIAVTDEGPGIPETDRERIFDLFHRVGRGDGQPAGTGMGLSIARGFIEANEGTIIARPGPNDRGTSFVMTLPMAPPDDIAEDDA